VGPLTCNISRPEEDIELVLVAGPPYRGYIEMVAAGFMNCGIRAISILWKTEEYSLIGGIHSTMSKKFRSRSDRRQNELNMATLEQAVVSLSPDYVVVLKGARISRKAKEFCHEHGIRTALWAYDSVYHVPIIKEVACDYDLVYFYEPADLERVRGLHSTRFLPMAYDPSLYCPGQSSTPTRPDFCFVGSLSGYPNRVDIILALAEKFKDRMIEVWTDTVHWYSPTRVRDVATFWRHRNLVLRRETADHKSISELYNRSMICLNMHHPQSKFAVNPRTFEVLGSCGFLLTDRRLDGIHGFEEGRDYVAYSSVDELIEKASLFLKDAELRKAISLSGHAKVEQSHTYAARASTILDDLRRC
jgi:spore maturation protein CgeB